MATVSTPRRSGAGKNPPSRATNGRRQRKPRRRGFWHAVWNFCLAVLSLICVATLCVIGIVIHYVKSQPATAAIVFAPKGRTEILSADGVTLARISTQNRVVVPLSQIPRNLQDATIAFEDKRFWQHSGIDPQGIARSLWSNVKNRDMTGQGGSTLEQQLARNIGYDGLNSEKSYSRKIHEWFVAQQIEQTFSKQQILEMYLNQVNYGSGSWGVEAAAQTYFGKHVKQLDLAQCALLAGLPNRPTYYNPYRDVTLAREQRNRVLQQMYQQGYITSDQYSQAYYEPIHLVSNHPPTGGKLIYYAPYFVNYVLDQLRREYGEDELDQGNLKVYTSLNFQMQQAAEQAVQSGIDPNNQDGPNQACLVAIDPKTGEIKAMVGGMNFAKSNFNLVTQAQRQPGSLMKVIVYGAAIDSGIVDMNSTVYDAPETFKSAAGNWTPKDDDGYSYRHVTLTDAMAESINVPAVKVLNMMGPETAVRYARVMGIDHSALDPVLSLALGSSAVTPLEMTDVYATVANGGNRPEPMAIERLTDPNDNTIEDVQPAIDQGVLAPGTVTQLDAMLRAVVTSGTGAGANNIPNAHGKTGTTQEHKDVWFIGYTPDLVVGVWAGHPLESANSKDDRYGMPMTGSSWGATVCVPIWDKFMQKVIPIIQAEKAKQQAPAAAKPAAKPATDATTADGTETVTVTIDNDTGLLAPAGSPNSHQETFAKGTAPTTMAPQYKTGAAAASGTAKNTAANAPNTGPAADSAQPLDTPDDSQSSPDGSNYQPAASAPAVSPLQTPVPPTAQTTAPTPAAQTATTPPPPAPAPVAPPVRRTVVPETVTVLINPEDGLLATQWDPVVVQRSYIKGQEPKKHSTMYGPPPGEH